MLILCTHTNAHDAFSDEQKSSEKKCIPKSNHDWKCFRLILAKPFHDLILFHILSHVEYWNWTAYQDIHPFCKFNLMLVIVKRLNWISRYYSQAICIPNGILLFCEFIVKTGVNTIDRLPNMANYRNKLKLLLEGVNHILTRIETIQNNATQTKQKNNRFGPDYWMNALTIGKISWMKYDSRYWQIDESWSLLFPETKSL